MNNKIILFIFFIISELVVIYSINGYFENQRNNVLKQNQTIVLNQYKVVSESLKELADTSFRGFVDGKKNIKEAFANRDRKLLYELLKEDYKYLSSLGFKQVHFHLPNNDSFLRMHEPDKYGDNLSQIRYSVNYVNKYKRSITGIETGKALPGYRFVYPLYFNNKYIGSVEFSFGIDKIVNDIEKTYQLHTHFLIDKKLFDSKVYDEYKKYYIQSKENKNYIKLNRTACKNKEANFIYNEKLLKIIENGIKNKTIFSAEMEIHHNEADHSHKALTFLPTQNIKGDETLYFVFYHDSEKLISLEKSHSSKMIIFPAFIFFMFGFLYMLLLRKESFERSKEKLQNLINAQENMVILTDGVLMEFANQKLFEFTGTKNLADFKQEHNCICDYFIKNDRFFHLGKIKDNENWVEVLRKLPHSERIVSMMDTDLVIHAFSITINHFDSGTFILNFADITQSMLNQIELEEKTIRDKLTNAYNREYFEQNYKQLVKNYSRSNSYAAVALVDIDNFKCVNDTYGHDVGDEVLKHFVNTIHKFSRSEDIFIRWGGEEFILLLKVKSKKDLHKALEHLRKVIEMQKFPTIGKKTCSIGGTIYKNNEDIEKTIKRADEAVYDAKAAGRNQVIIKL